MPYSDRLERQWQADKESKRNNDEIVVNCLLDFFIPEASYFVDKYGMYTLSSCNVKAHTFRDLCLFVVSSPLFYLFAVCV